MEPFVTAEELAAYLSPRAPRNLAEDALATLAIAGACEAVRTLTDQQLTLDTDDTVRFIGSGTGDLILPELPVIEVLELRVDDEVDVDWRLYESGVLHRTRPERWASAVWDSESIVEVDYSHGYEEVPDDLRLLATTIAARHYQQGIARQESTGNASVTFSTPGAGDLTSGERALIAKYRHPSAGRLAPVAS